MCGADRDLGHGGDDGVLSWDGDLNDEPTLGVVLLNWWRGVGVRRGWGRAHGVGGVVGVERIAVPVAMVDAI